MAEFVRAPKDFASGLLFIFIGAAALVLGSGYRPGTLLNMGPGYFPRIIGILLVVSGAIVALGSLRIRGGRIEPVRLRPLVLILASIAAFGWALERQGLLVALGLLIAISSLAQGGRRFWEIPVLLAVLAFIAWLIFVQGLGLAIPLWPGAGA